MQMQIGVTFTTLLSLFKCVVQHMPDYSVKSESRFDDMRSEPLTVFSSLYPMLFNHILLDANRRAVL